MKTKKSTPKADLRALAKSSTDIAKRLSKEPKFASELGRFAAFKKNGAPVCAFGHIVDAAGLNNPKLAGLMGNDEVLDVLIGKDIAHVVTKDLYSAAEAVADANDEGGKVETRAQLIAEALKSFAKAARNTAKSW